MNRVTLPMINALKPQPPPTRITTKSFNAIINRLSSQASHNQVLLTYCSMLNSNTPPDAYTFPSLLKSCTSLNLFLQGLSFHQLSIVHGYSFDPYIDSSLINFYVKFGSIHVARKIFDTMPERNVVPWTAIMGWYLREGRVDVALSIFSEMRGQGILPTPVTLLSLLHSASELSLVQCVHCCAISYGFESDIALLNTLVNAYGKCGSVGDARCLFEFMNQRDIVSWSSLASAYSQIGNVEEVLHILHRMKTQGIEPGNQTYVSLMSAISVSAMKSDLKLGKLVHAVILRTVSERDHQVVTALIVFYLKWGMTDIAFRIFDRMTYKDVILWTAMISGLVQNDCSDRALMVFHQMLTSRVEPKTTTIASALAACAQLGCLRLGTSIHGYIFRHNVMLDVPAQNSLVTMYANCNCLAQCDVLFNSMSRRDLVSWNAIIAGYAKNGQLSKAFSFFNKMRTCLERPDSITLISLLQVCASSGALHEGKWIHNFIVRSCFINPCILVETALVDMYSKCGHLKNAEKCFSSMQKRDVISWGTIIAGYGCHGKGEDALRIFSEFLSTGIRPNSVIFLSIISACSHSGLIQQGLSIYQSMAQDFGIQPDREHHACIVDLLSRAGRVEEAYTFNKTVFKEPTGDVLGILLNACRVNGNIELGDIVARDMLRLKPVDAGNYVQLAQSYATSGRWGGVGQAWTQMRSLGLRKLPAWSSIELHGTIMTFFSDHNSQPHIEDIVSSLKSLNRNIRKMYTDCEICI